MSSHVIAERQGSSEDKNSEEKLMQSKTNPSFCLSIKPTPLLNTPDFQKVFATLPLDSQGLLRPIEMIALPQTKFQVIQQIDTHILQVITKEYPCTPLYIDARFTEPATTQTPERKKILPPPQKILSHLENSLGLPYVWGGNWGKGIPEIPTFYPSKKKPSPHSTLRGLDCSGLLYEATSGFTPRNTSELLHFGTEVAVSKNIDSIVANVKPLDILIWPGHVIIIFNPTTTIESLLGKGVIFQDLKQRLSNLSTKNYIIRRFI